MLSLIFVNGGWGRQLWQVDVRYCCRADFRNCKNAESAQMEHGPESIPTIVSSSVHLDNEILHITDGSAERDVNSTRPDQGRSVVLAIRMTSFDPLGEIWSGQRCRGAELVGQLCPFSPAVLNNVVGIRDLPASEKEGDALGFQIVGRSLHPRLQAAGEASSILE
jgi:hypothetical protein